MGWCDASFPRPVTIPRRNHNEPVSAILPTSQLLSRYFDEVCINISHKETTLHCQITLTCFLISTSRFLDFDLQASLAHTRLLFCPTHHGARNFRGPGQPNIRCVKQTRPTRNFVLASSRLSPTMASTSGNTGWAQLRQQARSLESQVRNSRNRKPSGRANQTIQTESLFHTYSQFSTALNIPQKPTDEERNTEAKLQEILEKVP